MPIDLQAITRDLKRDTWCVMGMPLDATTEDATAQHIISSALTCTPCFFTTPNLNFAITAQKDNAFMQSVIDSDWVVADGMPLIWVARQLGIPLNERVAGSSVFDLIHKTYNDKSRPLRIVFFGGPDGVASDAFKAIQKDDSQLEAVGFFSPGFGNMDEMSNKEVIKHINELNPDIILIALGAKRGQEWIQRNREALNAPVISHLGAVINFVAGTVIRAPIWMQKSGLEWLWRIKEEGSLFKRYWYDGIGFLNYYLRSIRKIKKIQSKYKTLASKDLAYSFESQTLNLAGDAIHKNLNELREVLPQLIIDRQIRAINLSNVVRMDAAFIALLQLTKKHLTEQKIDLKLTGLTEDHKSLIRLTQADKSLDI